MNQPQQSGYSWWKFLAVAIVIKYTEIDYFMEGFGFISIWANEYDYEVTW